jgi:hypothetical protein
MNRADRRAQARADAKQKKAALKDAAVQYQRDMKHGGVNARTALSNPAYLAQHIAAEKKRREAWEKNGITKEDLKTEYERGRSDAQKDLTRFTMRFFYSAAAIASHRLFGFGETRICRLLDDIQLIMTEEITTCDIIQRCKDETGIDIFENDYDS